MKSLKTFSILFAVLLAAACGGKDKKKATAVSDVSAEDPGAAESTAPEPSQEGSQDRSSELQPVVYFEFDQSELDDAARAKLEENANWLKEDSGRVLTIEGHTDEVGTTDYNLALGERRAKTTKDYLVRLGVEADRVSIITFGEERPASEQDSLNRRSMFVATKK